MNDPTVSQLYLGENPGPVPMPRVVERAYLGLVAALGGVSVAALLVFAVATQSDADAERIVTGAGYATTLTSALAVAQARQRP